MSEQKMKGTRVLVTGAGVGIGKGISLQFARHGAAVAFHYSHDWQDALSSVAEVRSTGGTAEAFAADFTDLEQSRRLAQEAIDFLGGIDVLVNNSGITINRPFEQVTPLEYETLYSVNFRAMFFVTQAAVPVMSAQGGGAVINIASVHAYQGMHEHSVYVATKGAIAAFNHALAVELGPQRIRVNAIAPGCIVVEKFAQEAPDLDLEALARSLPIGRLGAPLDVAHLTLFLASDEAEFITGQTYVIDGGQTAQMASSDAFRSPIPQRWGETYFGDT